MKKNITLNNSSQKKRQAANARKKNSGRVIVLSSVLLLSLMLTSFITVAYAEPGVFILKWGSYGSGEGQFYLPLSVAVDSSDNVYVVDHYNNRIQKFDSEGHFILQWGSQGSGEGQFNGVAGIEIDSAGYLYVTEMYNGRVQKFTNNGTFVTYWGSFGSGDEQLREPKGIVVDNAGYVYVADTWNCRILKYTSTGVFVTKWGSSGSGDGQFVYPGGLAMDGSGFIYVVDSGNDRIQEFTNNGVFVTKWGSHGSGDGQFDGPFGIAFDSLRDIYIVDQVNNRVQKFAPMYNVITVPDDYPTIQGALDVASPGDSIFVRAGTYHEHITINKNNLTLVGEDRRRTIIDGDGSGSVVYLNSVIGVKISGLTLRNGTNGLFLTASSNNYVNGIVTNSNGQYGILMRASSNNNTIANSAISLNSQEGIRLDQGSYCSNNLIVNCDVFGNGGPYDGIGINFGDFGGQYYNTAKGCQIYANKKGPGGAGGHGIGGGVTTDETTVTDCHIHDNDGLGVIAGWSKWTIKNNLVHSNGGDGIVLDTSSNSIISNNTIYSNNNGITIAGLQHYGHNTIMNNSVYANYENGIYFNINANNNLYYHNSFANNLISNIYDTGLSNTGDNGYRSGGNFWSDYTGDDRFNGPYQNITGADGIGDTPYTANGVVKDRYPLMNPWNPSLSVEGVTTWYWTSSTTINSVAVGDVDGDSQKETVTGGSFYDGTRNVAQLVVWNSSSLTPEQLTTWYWTSNTTISSVAVSDVNGDGQNEIVTGGYYFDGSRQVAQLVVWKGSSLAVEGIKTWYWTGNTVINSVALGDVDGDSQLEVVTGGYYSDGARNIAQLVVWNGLNLALENVKAWYWTGNTVINSVALGDVDGDSQVEIVTGGCFFDSARNVAQLIVWTGSNLTVDRLADWYWTGNTAINSVTVGDVDDDGQTEIVTAGYYNDGSRNVAQLVVMAGSTLTVDRLTSWYWAGNTMINSVALGDVDGDGQVEIVTGGYYNDGSRNVGQMVVWDGSSLAVENIRTWYWVGDTVINSVCPSEINGDFSAEIITGGAYNDGLRWFAQLTTWGMRQTV